jgi:hypothetical protein
VIPFNQGSSEFWTGGNPLTETNIRTGGCLCSAVRYELETSSSEIDACHCDMCRRWAGGPWLSTIGDSRVRFSGEENMGRYRSSEWAERGFCKTCGSGIYYHLVNTDLYSLAAGTLDDQTGLNLTTEVFIDEKPDCYAFSNNTRKMTGAELMAKFAENNQPD